MTLDAAVLRPVAQAGIAAFKVVTLVGQSRQERPPSASMGSSGITWAARIVIRGFALRNSPTKYVHAVRILSAAIEFHASLVAKWSRSTSGLSAAHVGASSCVFIMV